ncbi:MAG: ATP-dependent Clp protease ATP-binding subunit [Bacilli bacterium]|nr:ATP-dependent Clp protease ATP-binding subunit [Bacilli bacterium]
MISNFNEEAQEILNKAKLEMLELKHPYVGTEHLVLSLLHTDNEIKENLAKYNLTYNNFKKQIIDIIGKGSKKSEFFLYTPLLKKVIENAIIDSKENNNGEVTPNHLFASLLDVGEGIAIRIFIGMDLDLDDIYDEFTSKIYTRNKTKEKKLLIDTLGVDLTEKAKLNQIDPVIGRDEEINMMQEILCRRFKNNPLLIGAPGVGKTALVEQLANLIVNDIVPTNLKNKRIISLDMASAVAGTKYRGEFEERMKKLLDEIENHDEIILFIDEIHTLIGAGGAEGAIDASNILKPALARGKIKCIGATTTEEYKKHFEKDKALDRRFQIINIEEPSLEKTKNILINLKPIYEEYHNVTIKDEIIDNILTLTEKYIYDKYRPDKQIDILDEVCSKVNIKGNSKNIKNESILKEIINKKESYIKEKNIKKAYEYKIKESHHIESMNKPVTKNEVTINDVAEIINKKTKIPVYEILKDNKKVIEEIKNTLNDTIIGQDKAINELIGITKRIKLGYKENKCISLLFSGPSGVGKTKLALTYAKLISKGKVIKLDMSEFSDTTSINKFLGSSAGYIGYDDNKYVLNTIKDNPTSVIIFDEIDKAHPKIINLLYQMLDEGTIKDAKNNTINLNNNIIILTTNKGTESKDIGFVQNNKNIKELKETFNIALLNRIDNIISFNNLNKQDIKKIINKLLIKLKKKYQEYKINISKNIINELTEESEYNIYGARKIEKIIKNKLENIIIDEILENKETINIDSIFTK